MVRTDSASSDCSDERDDSNWSSRISISRMKHELGLFSEDRYAASGYNERWPVQCRLAEWSTIMSLLHEGVSPRAVTISKTEYNRLAYSKWWSNAMRCKLVFSSSLFSVSSNANKNRMLCSKCWNGGRQREGEHPTLWYQLLGTRPSMRKITQPSMVKKNLRIGEAKQNTHTER